MTIWILCLILLLAAAGLIGGMVARVLYGLVAVVAIVLIILTLV